MQGPVIQCIWQVSSICGQNKLPQISICVTCKKSGLLAVDNERSVLGRGKSTGQGRRGSISAWKLDRVWEYVKDDKEGNLQRVVLLKDAILKLFYFKEHLLPYTLAAFLSVVMLHITTLPGSRGESTGTPAIAICVVSLSELNKGYCICSFILSPPTS